MTKETSKIVSIVAWVFAGLLQLLYLYSAAGKLFLHPEMMQQLNLEKWRIIIALGEIGSSVLFLFPKTNLLGTLLLCAYMGGAIIIHMTGGLSIVMPSIVLLLILAVYFMRNPETIKFQLNKT